MRPFFSKLTPFILTIVFLSFHCTSTSAADAANEVLWFANFAKANIGKTFCSPKTTTLNELAQAISGFSKAHPELYDSLTEKQMIQALSERYPCNAVAMPELMNTPISKFGPKNIEVATTGEYVSIDTKPTSAIMQKLNSTKAHENDDLVDQIVNNSANYMPPVFFSLANLFYRQGKVDDAIFWYNAGRLRGTFDADICTDSSARSAIPAMVQQIPSALRKKQFDDPSKLKNIIDRVLKWDESTPYHYDHRWISLHGMKALKSGLGNAGPNDLLTVPSDQWNSLAEKNRDQYRKSLNEAIGMLQKQ